MAATYCLKGIGLTMTAAQSLLHIFNATGSTRIIKVYRVWMENCQTTAVTGSQNLMQLQRITSVTAVSLNIEPVSYDTTNTFLVPQFPIATTASTTVTTFNYDASALVPYIGLPVWATNVTVPTTTVATAVSGATFTVSAAATAMTAGIVQIPAQFGYINCGSKATVTVDAAGIFRRVAWSSDESTIQVGDVDSLESNYLWCSLWDSGNNDASIEPIVLRAGFGLSVQNVGMAIGTADVFMEFTIE